MAKKNKYWDSAFLDKLSYRMYFDRLTELAVSMFEWVNLPETVDPRFLELCLFNDGKAVFFNDGEELGYLCLPVMISGRYDVYKIPINRTAYSLNGYRNTHLNKSNSVIIFNNMLHNNTASVVDNFARRLWDFDRTIDVNSKAQKTPVFIKCTEKQRLTLKNLYDQYDGNEPFIFGDASLADEPISCLKTDAPYVADKIQELKTQIWNEALTYLGISNINVVKKERMISDEVTRNLGGTLAGRYSRLNARKQACEQINRLFGLNVDVRYREDLMTSENIADRVLEPKEVIVNG